MKAWILEHQRPVEKKPLVFKEHPDPHPGAHEIRIRNIACRICRTDTHIAEGDLPLKKSPLVLGHEVLGIVDEAGENATGFKVGDRAGIAWLHNACGRCKYCRSNRENLCPYAHFTGWDADGGFAEYSILSEGFAFHLDKNQDYNLIWQERSMISMAHITRKDGTEFLQLANEINPRTSIEVFPFEELPEVIIRVKNGKVNGNAVILIADEEIQFD